MDLASFVAGNWTDDDIRAAAAQHRLVIPDACLAGVRANLNLLLERTAVLREGAAASDSHG